MNGGKTTVCYPFVGDAVGGSHLSALGLIRQLDRRRYEPLIVLHETDGPLADLLRGEGIAFERAPDDTELRPDVAYNIRAAYDVLRVVPRLSSFLRRRRVDIVHTNDGRIHVPWGVAGRLAGAKVLWHHRGNPEAFGLRRVAPFVADRVVAVSKFASPHPGLYSAASKCSVVHSPFDTNIADSFDRAACRAQIVAELGCPPETLVLGFVGSLIERKRPVHFVEAVAALRRLAPEIEVAGLLLGKAYEGLDKAALKRAAELGVSDRIHLLGFRYPSEPWLAGLDFLLVTAVDEPLGRTLVEAMLLETPVIATSSGGNPEAIRRCETGIIVPPDDPDAFARAVVDALGKPEQLRALVEAGKRDALSRFGLDKHVAAMTHIYEELVGS